MRLSIYICTVLLSFLFVQGVYAQTPTPHPNALSQGVYELEDLTAPEITLTGSDWTICGMASGSTILGLCNDDPDNTLEFFVEGIDYIVFQMRTASDSTLPAFDICLEGVCESYAFRSSTGLASFPLDVNGNSNVLFTTVGNGYHVLDFMTLHPLPIDLSAISGTGGAVPTPTPEPYYIYGTISGVSGTVATRFDMTMTVGEVAVSSALLFLLFSLWAFILLVIIPRPNHVGE